MRPTLRDFASVNDAAAATTKKLQKQALLAEYLRGLDERDLRLAIRYAGGRAFAATDERVLSVGSSLVSDVVLASVLKIDAGRFHEQVIRSGEIGNALAELWPEAETADESPPLTLAELAEAFDDLAATGAWENKRAILQTLFGRCARKREAAYLAKIMLGDLRTGVQEGVLQAAVAQAFGKPLAVIQRCQLLVGDIDEVAVLAKNDALDVAKFRLFHPVQFMLATPQETPEEAAGTIVGRTFYAEDKLDGIRAQVHKSGGVGHAARVAIYTRTMDRTDASFPDVVQAVVQLPGEFLLDGEIVPYRDGSVLPFAHIQKRLGRKVLTPKILRDNPAVFIAFDMLYQDGELLMDAPLSVRRAALLKLCGGDAERCTAAGPNAKLLFSEMTPVASAAEIATHFAAARERRNEGSILKDPASPYSPGRRGKLWLKLKTHLPTLDCVVTAAEYGHGKRRNSLSDYTFAVWDRDPSLEGAALVNIGKAYSGVTDEEIAQLTDLFHKLSVARRGHVHAVTPQVVLEIACDQIQRSERHAIGYALRFPRIKRIRWDKRIEDADRLERVAEIYGSTANTARQSHPVEETPKAEPTLFDGLADEIT